MYKFNIPLKDGELIDIDSNIIFYDPSPDEAFPTQDLEKSIVLTGIDENDKYFGITISLYIEDYLDLGIMDDFILKAVATLASNKEELKNLTVDELTDELMEYLNTMISNNRPEVVEISSRFEYFAE